MKKNHILLIAMAVLLFSYIVLDRHLFFYGKADLAILASLPFHSKPIDRPNFEGGFSIDDEYDFGVFSKGTRIDSFTVDKVIKYGFSEESIVALVADAQGRQNLLQYTRNEDPSSNREFVIQIVPNVQNSQYQWINIIEDEKESYTLMIIRNYIGFIIIILFVVLISRTVLLLIKQKRQAKFVDKT